jgi:diguanylate cyclase (GGDEF)-like protein
MTLSRQLGLLILSLVVVLFVGAFSVSLMTTRDYLESQLASHAQDAATSLGLSATTHVAEGDRAMVTTQVNAMFHRGDYLWIRLEDLDGEAWVERRAADRADGVPGWFADAFRLVPPEGTAAMMSGWHQVGRVRVVSHPGLAYQKLWDTARRTLLLFLLAAGVGLVFALVGLRVLLRPLKAIERQAEAICNREFVTSERRPSTPELRRVVDAMDRLSGKVGRLLTESAAVAERLRREAYQDPLTGLANRRQFMDVLEHRIGDPEQFASGGLILAELHDFKAFNQAQGYASGDRLLVEAARCLSRSVANLPRVTVARLAGADFALLLEGADEAQLAETAAGVSEALAALYNRFDLPSTDVAHVGAVPYRGQDAGELLAEADLALREAQREGANAWVLQADGQGGSPRSASAWRTLIEQAVRDRGFTLVRQPVVGRESGERLHDEVFLRLVDPARPDVMLPAAVVMPMAESVGLAPVVDRTVVEYVPELLSGAPGDGRFAINLSPASLQDRDFVDWLVDFVGGRSGLGYRLILEWPEYGVSSNVEPLAGLIARLAPLGVEFSLDHFGKGFTSFGYLQRLPVDYLKIDGSFIRRLHQHDDNRFFIKTITDIAHGLDVRVIAESVESEAVWVQLQELGVDGGRGFLFGRPASSDRNTTT